MPGLVPVEHDPFADASASLMPVDHDPFEQPSTAGDIAKSAGVGLVKGGLGLAGMPGDIGAMFNKGVDWAESKLLPESFMEGQRTAQAIHTPLTTEHLTKGLESVTGPLYEPKTTAGHYAQTIGEFVPGMVGGPEGLASRALTRVVAPAVTSEAAGQATEGTALEPYARVAGALIGHGAASGVRGAVAPGAAVPTVEELHDAATQAYKNARGYGVEIRRKPVATLADDIYSDLGNDGFRERNVPKTWAAIEELKSPAGKHVTVDDIESVRKVLTRAGANAMEGAEREAANRAKTAIDNWMARLDPKHVAVNPHYAQDVAAEMTDARGNWAAMRRGELIHDKTVEQALNRTGATGSGANINNVVRQNVASILRSKKPQRGFSSDELDQMRKVVRGTPLGNAGRYLGKLAPSGVVSGALGLDLGLAMAGATPGALAVPLLGKIAKTIGERSTAKQVRTLDEMVRSRSPLGRSLPQPAPTVPASPGSYGLAGELARQPGEPEGRAKGGAVKLNPAKSRKDSHYSPTRGTPEHHCGLCEHYRKPNACTIVGGFINAKTGGCDWFKVG